MPPAPPHTAAPTLLFSCAVGEQVLAVSAPGNIEEAYQRIRSAAVGAAQILGETRQLRSWLLNQHQGFQALESAVASGAPYTLVLPGATCPLTLAVQSTSQGATHGQTPSAWPRPHACSHRAPTLPWRTGR